MNKRTAVLLVLAGMMLNACNPLETSKPIETEAMAADSATTRGPIGEKHIDTLKPIQEKQKLGKLEKADEDTTEVYNPGLGIVAIALTDPPEELYHYDSTCFYYEDEEWFLDIYTSAMPDGEYYAYDDQNRFYIRARYGEYQFNLFDDWVQLGFPEIDIIDEGKRLHIVMTDIRTASYTVTDYSFMSEDFYFEETKLIELQGSNYMGKLDVK